MSSDRSPRARLTRLFTTLDVDRPVVYVVLTRGWQLLAAPLTLIAIARFFSPEVQGYHYTFASVLALQSFFELGFYLVIINVASHEWARLRLEPDGRIGGDEAALSRLVSLGRLVFKWYSVASVLFVIGVGAGGFFFLSRNGGTVQWQAPWLTIVVITGAILLALPFNSLLEGCNQVADINRLRLQQAVLSSIAFWIALALRWGLWASVVAAAIILLRDLYLLLVRYRRFFEPFFEAPRFAAVDWKTEVWPMQWRVGLSGMFSYLSYSLFNPVMFHYQGAAWAGRMGMTLQLGNVIRAIAIAWIQTRISRFGMLIAQRDYDGLDRYWRRTSLVSFGVNVVMSGGIWFAVWMMYRWQIPFATRLLPPFPTALLLLAGIAAHFVECFAAYLRAFKREPLLLSGVTTGCMIGALVWYFGKTAGATGAVAAYLGVMSLAVLPWTYFIWRRARRAWRV